MRILIGRQVAADIEFAGKNLGNGREAVYHLAEHCPAPPSRPSAQ